MVKKLLFDKHHVSNHGLNWGAKGEFSVKVNPPTKSDGPFLIREKPWESRGVNWANLHIEDGVWRLWYESFDGKAKNDMSSYLCYAESRDGKTWVKPELGIIEYNGSKANNIVIDRAVTQGLGLHGACVFKDPTSSPEARWRICFLGEHPDHYGRQWPVMCYGYSPDGLHWTAGAPELPLDFNHYPTQNFGSDTQCVVRWDNRLRRYVGYFRTWEPNGARSIARSETSDLTSWPMPKPIIRPDFYEDFQVDYYNSAASKVETMGDTAHYIFYSVFNHTTEKLKVCLATSRDGVHYDRYDRTPYLANDRDFDSGSIYVSPGIHEVDEDTQCIIYNGSSKTHAEAEVQISISKKPRGGLCMATFPRDRLQGLDTKTAFEFCVMGKVDPMNPEVVLNADIRGRVRAALIDKEGNFIPGFTADDCTPVTGDSLRHVISWPGGKTDVREADLKLYAEDATLYSVTVNK
ncbi:MAG: hypothetical protein E7460_02055 [Ruminococcaceae bacterium]|nr:hypothetical protein [Oscillospiraceae bacterium]